MFKETAGSVKSVPREEASNCSLVGTGSVSWNPSRVSVGGGPNLYHPYSSYECQEGPCDNGPWNRLFLAFESKEVPLSSQRKLAKPWLDYSR